VPTSLDNSSIQSIICACHHLYRLMDAGVGVGLRHQQYSWQAQQLTFCPAAHCPPPAAKQAQTANLANVAPKGCLKELIGAATGGEAAMQELITPECFNKLQLQRVDNKGTGCEPSSFTGEIERH
jgi:hypothetical protein